MFEVILAHPAPHYGNSMMQAVALLGLVVVVALAIGLAIYERKHR